MLSLERDGFLMLPDLFGANEMELLNSRKFFQVICGLSANYGNGLVVPEDE